MARCRMALVVALGLSVTGCATRQFVRSEIAKNEDAFRSDVERLTSDFREHQAKVRDIEVQAAETRRAGEETTRTAIEALGMADMAAGRAADALEQATAALRRADEAAIDGEQALAASEATAERLTRLWRGSARRSVVEAIMIHFRVDEWVPDDRARATLRDVVRRLEENPALVVELEGYADNAGAPPYNLRLSQLRAEAVGRFLVEQGVGTHRLETIGLGTTRPVANNTTAEGRRQNRRVVLRLLDPS
jgi:OOP family OmpA-OmpF porin